MKLDILFILIFFAGGAFSRNMKAAAVMGTATTLHCAMAARFQDIAVFLTVLFLCLTVVCCALPVLDRSSDWHVLET